MTPTEIRDLLTAACPELTWVVDDAGVSAEGTKLRATVTNHARGEWSLWMSRASRSADRVFVKPGSLRREVWRRLIKDEVRTAPGAKLLDTRVRLEDARFNVAAQSERTAIARRELASCEQRLSEANAACAAAEAAAKRLGVET
jgi:hypothetical protein